MKQRIHSIDIVRGLVMLIMALDHIRDFIHKDSLTQAPTDLATTTPALFFTRWITHLCAPTFVFLSGVSVFLTLQRMGLPATRKYLLTRGLILILLEFTLINFGLWWDVNFSVFLFNVIASIGFGFLILGLILKWPVKIIGGIGLLIIFSHNLIPLQAGGNASLLKTILLALFLPGAFPFAGSKMFVMGYAPIPWLGIMLAGFASGKLFMENAAARKRKLAATGLFAIMLFVVVRFINSYGDAVAWSQQKNGLFTFLSFINLTKYPPSLDFCLLFLGMSFLLLAAFENVKNRFTSFAMVYGKVPLFYFLIHWYIIHPVMFLILYVQGFKTGDFLFGFNFGRPKQESGLSLWGVWLVWIAVVLALYPLCRWYGQYKTRHKEKRWLMYM